MERRGFIKGLLASVGAGTALVKLATPAETTALAVNRDIIIGQPAPELLPAYADLGVEVYVKRGREYLPVGIIDSIEVHTQVDKSYSWSGDVFLTPSFREAWLKFSGPMR